MYLLQRRRAKECQLLIIKKVMKRLLLKSEELKVNVRLNTEVVGIEGEKGNFTIKTGDGGLVTAESVVLGIGLQGNLNKLRVPGADLPHIQYQLD